MRLFRLRCAYDCDARRHLVNLDTDQVLIGLGAVLSTSTVVVLCGLRIIFLGVERRMDRRLAESNHASHEAGKVAIVLGERRMPRP